MLLLNLLCVVSLSAVFALEDRKQPEGSGEALLEEGSGEEGGQVDIALPLRPLPAGVSSPFLPKHPNDLLPPIHLFATEISESVVRLWWRTRQRTNKFVARYRAKWEDGSYSDYFFKNKQLAQMNTSFRHLHSNTTYEFAVRISGAKEWSDSLFVRTKARQPNIFAKFTIHPTKDRSAVIVRWPKPALIGPCDRSPVDEYQIWITDSLNESMAFPAEHSYALPEHACRRFRVAAPRLGTRISGLARGKTYYFQMSAKNSAGNSDLSNVFSYTPSPSVVIRLQKRCPIAFQLGPIHVEPL